MMTMFTLVLYENQQMEKGILNGTEFTRSMYQAGLLGLKLVQYETLDTGDHPYTFHQYGQYLRLDSRLRR